MGPRLSLLAPSSVFFFAEGRAFGELASSYATNRLVRRVAHRGDGHPVLVLPGFVASDLSTRPLRRFLKRQGWAAHSWQQGRNLGFTAELEGRLRERIVELRRAYDRKVSLIGWSLGGVYAREVARAQSEDVRAVITLGSPFASPKANNSWLLYELITDSRLDDLDPELLRRMSEPPPVPSTAIYSRTDGIANWRSCTEIEGETCENVEVPGSHCGLGFNPLVYCVICDRLAQTEGRWRPFRRNGWRRHVFQRPSYPRG